MPVIPPTAVAARKYSRFPDLSHVPNFAVEDENVFRMHKTDPKSECPVAAQLGKVLSIPLRAAECALHTSLANTSIRDVATAIV